MAEKRSNNREDPAPQGQGENLRRGGMSQRTLGRYQLIRELGHGGQGFVYLAEDTKIHRQVALKIMLQGHGLSQAARSRFAREAEAAARIDDPGIARVYEFAEEDEILFIAMEFVPGQTLAQFISDTRSSCSPVETPSQVFLDFEAEEPPTPEEPAPDAIRADRQAIDRAVEFIANVALSLQVAHEHGLIHRDIKPGNLMVRPDQSHCILDFGMAQTDDQVDLGLTQTGDLIGTPAYMSPEQVRAQHQKVDRRTDIYSLGVCLFESCTLERPFRGKSTQDLLEAIAVREPIAARTINPRIPRDLESIIMMAIDKNPDRRYSSAQAFAEDLQRFLAQEPVLARPAPWTLKLDRWARRNPVIAATTLVVMVALSFSTLYYFLKSQEAADARLAAEQSAQLAEAESALKSVALLEKDQALNEASAERNAKELALKEQTEALERESEALREQRSALKELEKERDQKGQALSDRDQALADYDRLVDLKNLTAARQAARELYPPSTAMIPRLEAWLQDQRQLLERAKGHRAYLTSLRQLAVPESEEDRQRVFAREFAIIEESEKVLQRYDEALTETTEANLIADLEARRHLVERQRAEAQGRINVRRVWRFEDPRIQFQHDALTELLRDTEAFEQMESDSFKSVERCLNLARVIDAVTIEQQAAAWRDCQQRLEAHPAYAGLTMKPQLGLIPLGPDPQSGLEEFLHWPSHQGAIPSRDPATGTFVVTEELGLILVLVPKCIYLMGRQNTEPDQPRYFQAANKTEVPVHEVELEAYFLSKYEMTQGQWLRCFGSNPSHHRSTPERDPRLGPVDLRHPAESIGYDLAELLLPRVGLDLATEAEWECAAAAGTTQPWPGTASLESLPDYAHLHSQAGLRTYSAHRPVGGLLPNEYGFHDLAGNVIEMLKDGYFYYHLPPLHRGLRGNPRTAKAIILRGGSHNDPPDDARLRHRAPYAAKDGHASIGFRPARPVDAN